LLADSVGPVVSDGRRYVTWRSLSSPNQLTVYDSRRGKTLTFADACDPVAGSFGRFLLRCPPAPLSVGPGSLLDMVTGRINPVAGTSTGDQVITIGRYWAFLGAAKTQPVNRYVNLRAGWSRRCRSAARSTSTVGASAAPRHG
jgi:hypothetical protein